MEAVVVVAEEAARGGLDFDVAVAKVLLGTDPANVGLLEVSV